MRDVYGGGGLTVLKLIVLEEEAMPNSWSSH